MGCNHDVDVVDFKCVPQEAVDKLRCRWRPTINYHHSALTDGHSGVSLIHIEEIDLESILGENGLCGRCEGEYEGETENESH